MAPDLNSANHTVPSAVTWMRRGRASTVGNFHFVTFSVLPSILPIVAGKNNGPRPPLAFATHTIKDVNGNAHSISSKGVGEDVLLSLLTAQGYHISSAKQLARLHDPDEFGAELDVMARVLASFEISSKRIVDVMPMIFETALVCNFCRRASEDVDI